LLSKLEIRVSTSNVFVKNDTKILCPFPKLVNPVPAPVVAITFIAT